MITCLTIFFFPSKVGFSIYYYSLCLLTLLELHTRTEQGSVLLLGLLFRLNSLFRPLRL